MSNYSIEDPSFENDTKYKLIVELFQACEDRDRDLFKKSVDKYSKFRPLDKIQTKLLVRAKQYYCPEQETAYNQVMEPNFVDGPTDGPVIDGPGAAPAEQ